MLGAHFPSVSTIVPLRPSDTCSITSLSHTSSFLLKVNRVRTVYAYCCFAQPRSGWGTSLWALSLRHISSEHSTLQNAQLGCNPCVAHSLSGCYLVHMKLNCFSLGQSKPDFKKAPARKPACAQKTNSAWLKFLILSSIQTRAAFFSTVIQNVVKGRHIMLQLAVRESLRLGEVSCSSHPMSNHALPVKPFPKLTKHCFVSNCYNILQYTPMRKQGTHALFLLSLCYRNRTAKKTFF